MRKTSLFFTTLLLMGATRAFASGFTQPTVEYSADQLMETSQGSMSQKVHYAPQKMRHESDMGGHRMITIIRSDKNLIWQVMPQQKMYMEMRSDGMPAQAAAGDMSAYKVEQTVIGEETVNGVKTMKAKVSMTGPDRTKFDGFMWTSKEGNIMVKMDANAGGKNTTEHIKIELSNLKIGKQDPTLFEIPAGYQKMDMPMMNMQPRKR